MSAAQLIGLMYGYSKKDDLTQIIHDASLNYYGFYGELPTIAAVHPGTVTPQIIEIEVVERKFIRPGFILVGKFEKEN